MKKIITIFALSLSAVACANTPVFTSLGASDKDVFAGVKLEEKGNEPETYLVHITSGALTSEKVKLPTELIHREVVSLFPANANELLVLTQRTVEQGDSPQLHAYDASKKSWKKIGTVDCSSFAKVTYEKSAVKLTCLRTNEAGNEVSEEKKIDLKGIAIANPRQITLPVEKTENSTLKAELLGDAFQWKELKVSKDKKEKVFKP